MSRSRSSFDESFVNNPSGVLPSRSLASRLAGHRRTATRGVEGSFQFVASVVGQCYWLQAANRQGRALTATSSHANVVAVSYLGLDIGGSKCRYEWWPAGSAASGVTDPVHPAVDDDVAEKLARTLQTIAPTAPEAAVIAMAGVDAPAKQALREQLPSHGITYPVAIVEDTLAAAAAARLRDYPGVLLWSGTGSFAIARGEDGQLARVGGRGFAFSDEGSGYDLVRRAVVAVLHAIDGRGRDTLLVDSMTKAFGAGSPERLGGVVQRLLPREVASRLPVVLEAYEQDDWAAADVLQNAMFQLTQLGIAALKRVGSSAVAGTRVAYGGGVLEHNPIIRDGLDRTLQASFGGELDLRPLPSCAAALAAAQLASAWHQGDVVAKDWVERVSL
ncbi:MAG: N-acetylglucosamine kinase-like BadF-type ATPase [Planctomycetota bacterium]